MLPLDIERYVRKAFAPPDQSEALNLVAGAKIHDGLPAEPRLLRCALIAGDGTIPRLKYWLDGLAHDYRDVILEAEYIRKNGQWVQVRDLSQPFSEDA